MDRKSPVLEPLISNSKSQTLAVDHVAHAISTTQTTPPPDRRPGGHTPESDAEREVDGRTGRTRPVTVAWPGQEQAWPSPGPGASTPTRMPSRPKEAEQTADTHRREGRRRRPQEQLLELPLQVLQALPLAVVLRMNEMCTSSATDAQKKKNSSVWMFR